MHRIGNGPVTSKLYINTFSQQSYIASAQATYFVSFVLACACVNRNKYSKKLGTYMYVVVEFGM